LGDGTAGRVRPAKEIDRNRYVEWDVSAVESVQVVDAFDTDLHGVL
jgi:hypothetical protein